MGKFRFWLALGFVVLLLIGASASTGPGITWDEPSYATAGYSYYLWLAELSPQSFRRATINKHWEVNHEHPPAAKLVYGPAGALEKEHGLLTFLTARLLAVGMFVALVGLVYLFVTSYFGRLAGVLAALSLVLMPRVFGHGHLAALDVPVALACFATTLVFARADLNRWRAAAAGVLWGVALLTKINAVFLPLVLIPWALWYHRRRAVLPCMMLLVLGGATFVAGWPWLWHDTSIRIRGYAVGMSERTRQGEHSSGTTNVPVHYLGRTYRTRRAPWHYPFVMTLATVPVGLLVFAGAGARRSLARKGTRGIGVLILASGLLHIVVLALPMVPKYDGVRLFMPSFPFIACLAGVGAARVWDWRGRAGKAIVAAALAASALVLICTHPYELSYYNGLVGGAWGARKLGFETTYWGDTVTPEVMAYVNQHCPDGSKVAVWPRHQAFLDSLPWMRKGLEFRKDWEAGTPRADFLILFPRQSYLDEFTTDLVRNQKPIRQWTYLGVRQCMLFDLRRGGR